MSWCLTSSISCLKKKINSKSLVGLQALIYSWPVYDIPSEVLLLCSSPSTPSLPFLSKQLLSLPCLVAVPLLPLPRAAVPVPDHAALQWAHALLCSALLTASRSRRAAAGPALPLLAGPRSSSANRCHFCLLRCWAGSCLCEKPGRAMLSEGQVIWGTGTECKLRDAVLSLSASNWKTTLFLAELSLGSFSVSL